MVIPVQTSAGEQALNRVTGWIPAALRSYAIALTALLAAERHSLPLIQRATQFHGALGLVIMLLYVLVLLGILLARAMARAS